MLIGVNSSLLVNIVLLAVVSHGFGSPKERKDSHSSYVTLHPVSFYKMTLMPLSRGLKWKAQHKNNHYLSPMLALFLKKLNAAAVAKIEHLILLESNNSMDEYCRYFET